MKKQAPIIVKPRCTLPPNKVEKPANFYSRRPKHRGKGLNKNCNGLHFFIDNPASVW